MSEEQQTLDELREAIRASQGDKALAQIEASTDQIINRFKGSDAGQLFLLFLAIKIAAVIPQEDKSDAKPQ